MNPGASVEIPAAHYSLIDTERDGLPAVVILNDSALSFDKREVFPWQLEIVIQAAKTAKNGMPTRSEASKLDELGDAIERVLEDAKTPHGSLNVLFVARVTCNSQRELVYRVHDPQIADSILQKAISDLTTRPWEFVMASDESWEQVEVFQSLAESCRD